MAESVEMLIRREGGCVKLLAPGVGVFTGALAQGVELSPGQAAGAILGLGRSATLIVPEGASGVIASPAPERIHAPVGFGDVLYEIAPAASAKPEQPSARAAAPKEARGGALVLRSPQTGRFYHRPAPGESAFVSPGRTIEDGQPVGLIEVMKTFSHVPYRASDGLPRRAKIVRFLAADGADVNQGEPLLEIEPA
jgi:biotin carboxyl carrier protein